MLRWWKRHGVLALGCMVWCAAQAAGQAPQASGRLRYSGPWNVAELKQTPQFERGPQAELVQQVFYEGEPLDGRPTRVFAYYAQPIEGEGPFPAMVLVHGEGGKAFPEWATLWAQRGYAALAMDLSGRGPDGQRLPDGGPEQGDRNKFKPFEADGVRETWEYHAVADVLRGVSLLSALSEVDPERIGATGIGWGGCLTCIAAGVDDRLKAVVPVYGGGFLYEDSIWLPTFRAMRPDDRKRWIENFDPSRYLPGVRCPMLFVSGANDYAFPLDSLQKSYQLVPGPVQLCIRVKMPHTHPDGWAPKEIGRFVNGILKTGAPLSTISAPTIRGGEAIAEVKPTAQIRLAELHFAAASGEWSSRPWRTISVRYHGNTVTAPLPPQRPIVFMFTITDERNAVVSSPHVVLDEP